MGVHKNRGVQYVHKTHRAPLLEGFGVQAAFSGQSIRYYAHSSPSYFRCGARPAERAADANFFLRSIDESLKWIGSYGRYNNDQQREEVRELFRRGRAVYAGLAD